MAGEKTVPLLPCRSIDDVEPFYEMLGFTRTYRQDRPYPCIGMRLEDVDLQFFGMDGFKPEDSYGSCVVLVADTSEVFEAFAAGMRKVHGKLLVSGIPRITRPRKRKNANNHAGFTVVDPGGNWIRFMAAKPSPEVPAEALARSIRSAVVMGDSLGKADQAARILDNALSRDADTARNADLAEALIYRAELAVRLDDRTAAREFLDRVGKIPLTEDERESLDGLSDLAEILRD
ncbi:VOC family protein [Fodinicola acaciae]|uniref:VOC family protein n=1 Tax=Fodinicola acaciae TaxID=2681555 RepID=UPI001651B6EA|nr:VOC family protein [Fodinicola acaciae]